MNSDQELNIIIKAKDQASQVVDNFRSKVENMQPVFQKMAAVGTASFVAISAIAVKGVSAYAAAERASRQLEHAVVDVSKGTAEQVKQIDEVSMALEKKAGIDADSLKMGAAQLSTFGLQSASVVKLTKSLADFTVNQNGLNASADQYVSSANIIAKALNGQFGVLEKSGIRFTEAQQKLILFGQESEKVAALQEGLNQNLRETTDTVGGVDLAMAKLSRTTENIEKAIGKALIPALDKIKAKLQPFIEKISQWAENNPELVANILLVTGAVAGLTAVIGVLGIALPAVINGFGLLLTPVAGIAIVLAAVVAGLIIFRDKLGMIADFIDEKTGLITFFKWAWDNVKTTIMETLLPSLEALWESLKPLEPILMLLAKVIGGILIGAIYAITLAVTGWVQVITNIIALGAEFAKVILDSFTTPINKFIDAVKSAVSWVVDLINKMSGIGGGIKGVASGITKKIGNILGFEHGGTVPGAIGTAVPIIAHGGETIIPAGRRTSQSGGGVNINMNINYPQFKSQEDVQVFRDQIETSLRDIIRNNKLQPI